MNPAVPPTLVRPCTARNAVPRHAVPRAVVGLLALTAIASGCSDSDAQAAESPSKVTVAGDSISVGLVSSLRSEVDESVTVKVIFESGTGLARPDRFDWPVRLEELVRDFPPEVHRIATELAAQRDWVEAQDLAELTGSGDEETSECLIADGLHLSLQCYESAARSLSPRLGVG